MIDAADLLRPYFVDQRADQLRSEGNFDKALAKYEKAFRQVSSVDPLVGEISAKVVDMIEKDQIPFLSKDEAKRVFPHWTFIQLGQSPQILFEQIEEEQRNIHPSQESYLKIAKCLNQLGASDSVHFACNPFLSWSPLAPQFLLEKAIACLQSGDLQQLALCINILEGVKDPEIKRYVIILKRESFLNACYRVFSR